MELATDIPNTGSDEVTIPDEYDYLGPLLSFMWALAEQDFGSHSKVVFAYIHGFSTSLGEEMWLDAGDFPLAVSSWGMTSELYHDWAIGRIDAWVDAFSGHEDKLIRARHVYCALQSCTGDWSELIRLSVGF